jgi:hypothetical protein
MTSRDFCFWLQGFFELSNTNQLSEQQVSTIKAHLNLAFKHDIDPSMGGPTHQAALNAIHDGKTTTMRC